MINRLYPTTQHLLITFLPVQLAANEMKAISDIVKGDAAAKDKAFADGLYVAGDRFVMARAEDGTIYARKVGSRYYCAAGKRKRG